MQQPPRIIGGCDCPDEKARSLRLILPLREMPGPELRAGRRLSSALQRKKAPMMPRIFALSAMIGLSLGLAIRAADWPQFRGPTGQGHAGEMNLPLEWGKDKNVAWVQPIPGLGWSSPVVVAGRVYLTTAVSVQGNRNGDQSLQAHCLDAKTGKQLWQKEVFRQDGRTAPAIHPKNSHASPTPVVHDGKLYVHFGHQGTTCLDLEGKILWRNTDLKYRPAHGNGGSPIVVDDKLIFNCDGSDVAFVV